MCCHFPFVDGGRQIAQYRVQPHAVVEVDDVVSDVILGLGLVGILALPDTFHFEVQEEALGYGIVPAIAFPAHATNEAMLVEQVLV